MMKITLFHKKKKSNSIISSHGKNKNKIITQGRIEMFKSPTKTHPVPRR